MLDNERKPSGRDFQRGSYLGPSYSDDEIREMLDAVGAPYTEVSDEDSLVQTVAERLADQKVVGWFQGRMEYGPRALGARSILGDPRSQKMQSVMNLKIKYRESFRPFAPAVLEGYASAYFEIDRASPYMLLVAPVAQDIRLEMSPEEQQRFGIDKLNVGRSSIPAVTHVDYSARVQTVHEDTNPLFSRLLRAFHAQTGCPVLVNTSFNIRGEPIVCSPQNAYNCFLRTEMDCLVLGRFVLDKRQQRGMQLGRRETLQRPWNELAFTGVGSGYGLDD